MTIQRSGDGLRDRRLDHEVTMTDGYDDFREQVERWLSREVMSRTPVPQPGGGEAPIRRERGLVGASNLRELYGRLAHSVEPGERVRLRARFVAGRYRYERVVFETPGLVALAPIDIQGDPVDRIAVRRHIEDLTRRRREQLHVARHRIIQAISATQSAVLEGSTRYRPTHSTASTSEFIQNVEGVGRFFSGEEPRERLAERHVRQVTIRNIEEEAERRLRVARREMAAIDDLDRQLTQLHGQLGEEYHPHGTADLPDYRRYGRGDTERIWEPENRWPEDVHGPGGGQRR